jgi:hypothetical protein
MIINILKNDNSNPYMSIWNQINVNGSLFIIVSALYFKIMPMKIITIILLLVILIVFYPLNEYVENYVLNETFTPNINDCLKAIEYSSRKVFDINDVTKIRYYIGLNELDPTEIIINFKGTDPSEEKNILSNLNIKFIYYPKELITNPDIINDSSNSFSIHTGYLDLYLSVRDIIYSRCNELLNNGAKKIFISGYSLGGGVSTICAFDFHSNLNKLNIVANNINSISIAAPPIGDLNFVNLYNKYVINSIRLTHINDPIPKMTSWYYKHTKNEYLLSSNVFSIDAHMLLAYNECIIKKITTMEYLPTIFVYGIIIGYLMFIIRRFYTRNIINTRHFN